MPSISRSIVPNIVDIDIEIDISLTPAISNGVRQGAISSPILWNLYCNILILNMRNSGIGCNIAGQYCGIFIYADDIILLSASRIGLQAMVDICGTFAKSHNLTFSTNICAKKSKTKCILFAKRVPNMENIAPILLNGTPLPWVDQITHLGHILQNDNSMNIDCNIKRGQFIGKVHSLLQEFYFSSPTVLMKLVNIYCTSFYGSNCYDIFSNNCDRIYRAWNVGVRRIFKVDRTCHRYLIEGISECLHPKVILSSHFIKFHDNNLKCNKPIIRTLSKLCKDDNKTVYGRNLYNISRTCNIDVPSLTPQLVKTTMSYFPAPENQLWRLPLVKELLALRSDQFELTGFNYEEMTDLLKYVCTT